MDSHLRTFVNSLFRTPQRALCDPKKTINWHLQDVDWRTLANGLLLRLHQCCGTIYLLTLNDPRPWTFSSLVLRLICFNLHILRDCSNVCVNVWLCYYLMLCNFGIGRFSFCSYATRIFTSALVSKGQISLCNFCPILKPALYKYHIIIIIIRWQTERGVFIQTDRWLWLRHYLPFVLVAIALE